MNKNYIARSGRKANDARVLKIKKNIDVANSQNCEHPRLDEVETNKGDCHCGCRDWKECPDCGEIVECEQ